MTPLSKRQCSDNTHVCGSGHRGKFFFVFFCLIMHEKQGRGPQWHIPSCSSERNKERTVQDQVKKACKSADTVFADALQTFTLNTCKHTSTRRSRQTLPNGGPCHRAIAVVKTLWQRSSKNSTESKFHSQRAPVFAPRVPQCKGSHPNNCFSLRILSRRVTRFARKHRGLPGTDSSKHTAVNEDSLSHLTEKNEIRELSSFCKLGRNTRPGLKWHKYSSNKKTWASAPTTVSEVWPVIHV